MRISFPKRTPEQDAQRQADWDRDINRKFCSVCHTKMNLHPESVGWLKCPVCGFSKELK